MIVKMPHSGLARAAFTAAIFNATAAQASIITGAGPGGTPSVHQYSSMNGGLNLNFNAFGPTFTGGVRTAGAHVSAPGSGDIITGPGSGGGPQVQLFNGSTGALMNSFFAYSVSYTGGVFVAGGDITGDGTDEIITGTDQGASPNVKAFNAMTGTTLRSFFAFEPGFTGGVRVAAGDITGDGIDDIIVARGPGAVTEIRAFDGANNAQIRAFLPFGVGFTSGAFIAAADVNGDGYADIIASVDSGNSPHIKVFDGVTSSVINDFNPFSAGLTGGVRIAAADLTGDGKAEIIATIGAGGTGEVRTFNGLTGAQIGSLTTTGQAFANGLWVAANPTINTCPADIAPQPGGDGIVNVSDLLMVINAWGTCPDPQNCPADIQDDGIVNVSDLLMVINSWGACP